MSQDTSTKPPSGMRDFLAPDVVRRRHETRAIALVAVGVFGYSAWQGSVDTKARAMLAEAMVIEESRVTPPGPPLKATLVVVTVRTGSL